MLDGADRIDREAELHQLAERVGQEGRHLQVRHEAPLGLVVGVADVIANQDALAGDIATPGHSKNPFSSAASFKTKGPDKRHLPAGSPGF